MQIRENADIKKLCEAIAKLSTAEEVALVFEDLCTIQELLSLSQRLSVANMLSRDMNYSEITKKTGVSSATICRVNRCLNYGSGGYKMIIDSEDKNDN